MNTQLPNQREGPRRGLVTDILIWLECFATLVSVITSKHPDRHLISLLKPGILSESAGTLRAWHGLIYETNLQTSRELEVLGLE